MPNPADVQRAAAVVDQLANELANLVAQRAAMAGDPNIPPGVIHSISGIIANTEAALNHAVNMLNYVRSLP